SRCSPPVSATHSAVTSTAATGGGSTSRSPTAAAASDAPSNSPTTGNQTPARRSASGGRSWRGTGSVVRKPRAAQKALIAANPWQKGTWLQYTLRPNRDGNKPPDAVPLLVKRAAVRITVHGHPGEYRPLLHHAGGVDWTNGEAIPRRWARLPTLRAACYNRASARQEAAGS